MQKTMARSAASMANNLESVKVIPIIRKIENSKLVISTHQEVRFIAYSDILYCKSIQNYTTVYLTNGKSYMCSKTLKEIEGKLPPLDFYRTHRTYVVNINLITAIKKKSQEVELNHDIMIPYSPTQRAGLFQLFRL